MEIGRCIECGLQVGGLKYKAVPGFQEFRYALIHFTFSVLDDIALACCAFRTKGIASCNTIASCCYLKGGTWGSLLAHMLASWKWKRLSHEGVLAEL